MVWLDIERAYRPGLLSTDSAYLLLDKRRKIPDQNIFAVFGAPDKVVSQLVGDVFGVQCIHTRQYNICSNPCEVHGKAGLPPLVETQEYPRRQFYELFHC